MGFGSQSLPPRIPYTSSGPARRRQLPRTPSPNHLPNVSAPRGPAGVETLERRVFLSAGPIVVQGEAVAEVVGRFVFYNNSAFDGRGAAADARDDAAIANDKAPLLPGERAGVTNYTNYSKGINGVMLDVTGLKAELAADDFEFHGGTAVDPAEWDAAPAPASVTRRAGAGQGGADRVTILWDDGAIRNQWLRVTVKANDDTGLAAPDVFYFGNLVADTADARTGAAAAIVSVPDLRGVRNAMFSSSPVTGRYDVNRDGRVSVLDFTLLRRNYGASLPMFTAPEQDPGGGGDLSFHVPVRPEGRTPVTLHPIESVRPGQSTRVTFGVPFPKGFVPVGELSEVRLLDGSGAERPVYVELLSPWRDLSTGTDLPSARSVMVQTDVAFPDPDGDGDADPVAVQVEWGRAARSLPALAETPVRQNWVRYDNAAAPAGTDYKAADDVLEPPAYAVFTPQWYGDAVIKTRLLPEGTNPAFAGYDSAFQNFAATAVNDVDPRVTAANLIHYADGADEEPWLFDRAMTLFQLAFRSGSVTYLREAHRASQYYANHIDASGYFDIKGPDLKYVYGEAISADYWLTGDDRLLAVHQRMIRVFDRDFDAAYTPGQMWTERHAAYKLLGYVTGYELLGDPALAQKARDTFTAYVNHQNNPPAGAANTGLLMHRSEDHIEGGAEWVASPWMTALLVDAVERYYVHSGDARVPAFVARVADGINRVGESMYYTSEVDGTSRLVPFYLAGPGLDEDQHQTNPWGDIEHAVDVSKVFALAYFFSRQQGAADAEYAGRFNELQESAQAAFQYWTRPNGPSSGLSVYRLNPPRKFNWWFRTTANRDFLVGADAPTTPDTQSPTATLTAADLTSGGGTHYVFSVTYFDNRAIDVSTLGSGDLLVRGPNGFNQIAEFVSVNNNSNGNPRVATYRVAAPGGTWDPADDGSYQIDVQPSQIADTAGRFVNGEFLGRFTVATTGAPMITNVTAGSLSNTGATITWTTDVATTTQVEYGTTAGYGQLTTLDAAMGTSHSVTLTGLSPGTTYHFRVLSRTAAGVLGASTDYTFTTTGTSGGGGGDGTTRTLVGQFGLINNRNTVLRHTDADGTVITASLRGGGVAQLYTENGRLELDLVGTGPRSVLSLAGRGGDRRIALGDVVSAGTLRAAKLLTSDLTGSFFINGAAGRITLGSINNGTVAAAGDLFGVLVKGAAASARVLAGAHLGADGRLGGGDDAAAVGSIRRLTLIGGATGSVFAAGTLPGANGTFGDGDDVHAGGATSAILAIATRGDVDSTSRFEAGTFGRAKIGRFRVDPATDSRFVLVA